MDHLSDPTSWGGEPGSLARLRAEARRRPGRWHRRAMYVAVAAMAAGATGTAVGSVAVEDAAAVVALGCLTFGSVVGLCGPRRENGA